METKKLSHPQKRIAQLEELYSDSAINIVCGITFFDIEKDPKILKQAIINTFIENESLWMKIVKKEDDYHQYVDQIEEQLYVKSSQFETEEEFEHWKETLVKTPIKMLENILFETGIVVRPGNKIGFYLKFHHIISDAWSIVSATNQVVDHYIALVEGEANELSEKMSYLKFIDSEQAYFESPRFIRDEEYWLEKFSEIPELPLIYGKSQNEFSINSSRDLFIFSKEFSNEILAYTKEKQVSIFNLVLGALVILIGKLSNSEDIPIGTTILNRSNRQEKEMLGMFISTLPERFTLEKELPASAFIDTIRKQCMGDIKHQKYPFDILLKKLRDKNVGVDRLFNIIFSYQNAKFDLSNEEYNHNPKWLFNGYSQVPLAVHINDRTEQGALIVEFDYSNTLYSKEQISDLFHSLENIIRQLIQIPDRLIKDIQLIEASEQNRIIESLDFSQVEYDQTMLIHEELKKTAEKYPTKVSIKAGDEEVTYQELDDCSTKLAMYLQEQGLQKQEFVCICLPSSIESIIAMFAVLKAGAIYVPIDVDFPQQRKEYILKNTKTRFVITKEKDIVANLSGIQVLSAQAYSSIEKDSQEFQPVSLTPNDSSYVIYTSGSTGEPKGVVIPHKNVIRLMKNEESLFDFNEQDNWLLGHSIAFDFSVWEIYGALLFGGTLIIVPKEQLVDPEKVKQVILEEEITILNQTPQAFYSLAETFTKEEAKNCQLRNIIFGGEALSPYKLSDWRTKNKTAKLINMYGITETTVHVTYKELTDSDLSSERSTIGKPLPTLGVVILNDDLKVQPVNVVGELCVYGEGVAKEYLGAPELTAEKFSDHPFRKEGKLYRSGDLGCLLPNGDIEYIGRKDFQVKIRGYRIELGEVEKSLNELEFIQKAIVLDKKVNGYDSLWGYIVMKEGEEAEILTIRNELSKQLPSYMVPSYFAVIKSIPLTVNGKVNRKELLELEETKTSNSEDFEAPIGKEETILVDVWKEVLQQTEVGRGANFFELGGDSIKAIQIVSRLRKHQLDLEIKNILKFPILSEQSTFIIEKGEETISQTPVEGEAALLPIQEEFFRLNYAEPNQFNHAIFLKNKCVFIKEQIQQIFDKISEHHDSLRLRYVLEKGMVSQKYHPYNEATKVQVTEVQLDQEPSQVVAEIKHRSEAIHQSIDITKGPIAQMTLFTTSFGEQYLLIVVHHLVIDGVSWRVILEDIETLLQQESQGKELQLPAKTNSYQDWSVAIQNDMAPTIFEQPVVNTAVMKKEVVSGTLSEDETAALIKLAKELDVSLVVLLTVILTQAIKEEPSLNQNYIYFETHGRVSNELTEKMNVSRTVGWFTMIHTLELPNVASTAVDQMIRKVQQAVQNIQDQLMVADQNSDEITSKSVCFNFLGFSPSLNTSNFFEEATMFTSESKHVSNKYGVVLDCFIQNKQLIIDLKANQIKENRINLNHFLKQYIENYKKVIRYFEKRADDQSDIFKFDDNELIQEDLDEILSQLDN